MEEKERIIEFGKEKFFKEGFHKITMSDIASELKMSKKTIYKFFPSKDDFVKAITKHFMNSMKAKIVPALNTEKNAIEKLEELLRIFASVSVKMNSKMLEDLRRHLPSLWGEIDRFRTEMMFGNLTKVIDQGKKEGLFKDYPTLIVMNILISSIRSVVTPDFILNNNVSIIEAAKTVFKIVIGGILTEKGKKIFNKTIIEK
jgi:AcrR family transcriptional regulator